MCQPLTFLPTLSQASSAHLACLLPNGCEKFTAHKFGGVMGPEHRRRQAPGRTHWPLHSTLAHVPGQCSFPPVVTRKPLSSHVRAAQSQLCRPSALEQAWPWCEARAFSRDACYLTSSGEEEKMGSWPLSCQLAQLPQIALFPPLNSK